MRIDSKKLTVTEAALCFLALFGSVVLAGAVGSTIGPAREYSLSPVAGESKKIKEILANKCVELRGSLRDECLNKLLDAIDSNAIARADLAAQKDMARWALLTMIVGVLTAIGSFIALFFIRQTLIATNEGLVETRTRNLTELRAYLIVIPKGIETFSGEASAVGQIEIKNIGKTPAKDVSSQVRMKMARYDTNDFPISKYEDLAKRTLPPEASMRQGSKDRLNSIKMKVSSFNFLYVYGCIHYTDYSGERHFTRFCHRYNKAEIPEDFQYMLPFQAKTRILIDQEKARHHINGNDAN